jgi:hypothetical protein
MNDKFLGIFLTHRHIGHIEIINKKLLKLCDLCAYVLKKM